MIAYAQGAQAGGHITYAKQLVDKINAAILYPLITLLLAIAVLYFLWGVFQMVMHADNDEVRSQGRLHMLYGVIGIVIMLSAFAILTIAANTAGIPKDEWSQYTNVQP